MRRETLCAVAAILALVGGTVGYAAYYTFTATGTQNVVVPQLTITGDVNGNQTAFNVVGNTATIDLQDLIPEQTNVVNLNITNTGTINAPNIALSANSDNPTVATISPLSVSAFTLNIGDSVIETFTVTAVAEGSATITITVTAG